MTCALAELLTHPFAVVECSSSHLRVGVAESRTRCSDFVNTGVVVNKPCANMLCRRIDAEHVWRGRCDGLGPFGIVFNVGRLQDMPLAIVDVWRRNRKLSRTRHVMLKTMLRGT